MPRYMHVLITLLILCGYTAVDKTQALSETVVLDAGHGLKEVGESGCNRKDHKNSRCNFSSIRSWPEHVYALQLSEAIHCYIRKKSQLGSADLASVLTRRSSSKPCKYPYDGSNGNNINIDFEERVRVSVVNEADAFIAVHFNPNTTAAGTEALYDDYDTYPKHLQRRDKKYCDQLSINTHRAVQKYYSRLGATAVKKKSKKRLTRAWLNYMRKIYGYDKHSALFTQMERQYKKAKMPRPRTCFLEVEFPQNPSVKSLIVDGGKLKPEFVSLVAQGIGDFLIDRHGAKQTVALPRILVDEENRVPSCVTPHRLQKFVNDRNAKLRPKRKAKKPVKYIANLYKKIGKPLKVRWDFAFYQMLIETNYLLFVKSDGSPGGVPSSDNNFAGVGATIPGKPGDKFKTNYRGVLGHLKHVRVYSGNKVSEPMANRTRAIQGWLAPTMRKLGRPVTFGDMAKEWTGTHKDSYGPNILAVAKRFHSKYCRGRG